MEPFPSIVIHFFDLVEDDDTIFMMSGDNIKLESIVLDEDLIKDDNVFS